MVGGLFGMGHDGMIGGNRTIEPNWVAGTNGWTYSEYTDVDWADVNTMNELIGAYNERRQALGQSPVATISAGDDVQLASLYSDIQSWIGTYSSSFIQSYDYPGTKRSIQSFTSTPETYADTDDFTHSCGLQASHTGQYGWERTADGVNFDVGTVQVGDVIGPWIFNDLEKALNCLTWTPVNSFSWSVTDSNSAGNGAASQGGWGTAYGNLITNYPNGAAATGILSSPGTYYYGWEDAVSAAPDVIDILESHRYSGTASGSIVNYLNPSIEVYLQFSDVGGVYDNQGDSLPYSGTDYHYIEAISQNGGSPITSSYNTNTGIPSNPACAEPGICGWYIYDIQGVAMYDVAGGFTYY